ncbi:MAG: right-handed parallel beta-helix repeat-containing protein [Hyphomicrobiaceae bacterium]
MSNRILTQISTRAVAVFVMACLGWSTLGLAGEGNNNSTSTIKWHPWFEIGGYYNSRGNDGGGSFGTSRGESTAFVPLIWDARQLFFSQLTAKFFEDEALEGNLALGYRYMLSSGFNFGAWLGGDVRDTEIDNTFWQLSGGFELLSHDFDARLNWYGPATDPQLANASFAEARLSGNQISMIGGKEVAMMGIDTEIGVRVPTGMIGLAPEIFELRLYGGGYYFDSDDAYEEIAGGKGRVELRINDVLGAGSRVIAEYEITHDDVRDTRHEAGARARIPLSLGGVAPHRLTSLTEQERRMMDGLERDTDVITGRSDSEPVEDALTGTDFARFAYVGNGGSITDQSEAAGPNSLIIVNGEVTGQQVLQGDQTLQGGGSTIAVRGLRNGIVTHFKAPGARAKLTSPDVGENNLNLDGSNTHVSGLSIFGRLKDDDNVVDFFREPGDGIALGSYKRNMFITNVDISNTANEGILGDEFNENVTIRGVTVKHAAADGIQFNYDNKSILIEDVTIGAARSSYDGPRSIANHGIAIWNRNQDITIRDVTIMNTVDDGILFNKFNTGIRIEDVTIRDAGDDGIIFYDDNVDITIERATIGKERQEGDVSYDILDEGIDFRDRNRDISIRDVTIMNTAEQGLQFGTENETGTIENITIDGTGGNGVFLALRDNNLSFNNVTIGNVGKYAFVIKGGEVKLNNVTINGPVGQTYTFRFAYRSHTDVYGSVFNSYNIEGSATCLLAGRSTFEGALEFTDGAKMDQSMCDVWP